MSSYNFIVESHKLVRQCGQKVDSKQPEGINISLSKRITLNQHKCYSVKDDVLFRSLLLNREIFATAVQQLINMSSFSRLFLNYSYCQRLECIDF